MKLHTLKPAEGSIRNRKRIGRGQGSGRGGTSTRGHKGAKSRSGYKTKLGFEGGQMPLQRRVPKFGFTNHNKVTYQAINLDTIQELADNLKIDTVDFAVLKQNGLVSKKDLVKVLGRGELTSKVNVSAHSFSATAIAAIEKVGGSANKI
ncbi:50S ribosomal protein L15 [Cyclobacterium lianum]|nr:50S ribosomal protein L15 [Cyclobacterium lianum]